MVDGVCAAEPEVSELEAGEEREREAKDDGEVRYGGTAEAGGVVVCAG